MQLRRASTAVLVAFFALGLAPVHAPAGAQVSPPAIDCANNPGSIGCQIQEPSDEEEGDGEGGGAAFPVDFEYYFDDGGEGVGAEPGYEVGCWGIRAVPEGEGGTFQEAVAQQTAQGENGVLWGNCRIEDTVDPAVLAAALWQTTVRPPPPTPLRVQPGKAVTGLRAYLEIGGDVPAAQTIATPIGPAGFTMTPRYVVTWGDGGSVGTESQGVPWPGGPGEVTHVYQDAGGVTVTVQAFWHSTWSLAGQGGDLPELAVPTEGSLELPVERYQVTTD